MLAFELLRTEGHARRGRLTLRHGVVETPVFMPVGAEHGELTLNTRAPTETIRVVAGPSRPHSALREGPTM